MSAAPSAAPAAEQLPTAAAPLTVLIADDHPLFRRGLAHAVRRHPELELVGEAADGREALELIAALEPDVAVLDHRMPGLSGVEVCGHLRRRPSAHRTSVLVLTAFEDDDLVRAAAAAGAAGYVGKGASQGDICRAIAHVGAGGLAYPSSGDRRDF